MGTNRTDARAALRAAMLGWREPLTAIVSLPDKQSVEPWYFDSWERSPDDCEQVFWLPCQVSNSRQHIEAAELFALLARVDFALWQELASEFWPENASWADFLKTRTALRVGLAANFLTGVRGIRHLCAYITGQNELMTSSRYKQTRQLLSRVALNETLPFVPIRLVLVRARDVSLSGMLWKLVDVLSSFDNQRGLRITQLKLETSGHKVNEMAMGCIEAIRAAGIQVTDLPSVDAGSRVSSHANCFKSLASILNVDAPVGTKVLSTGGVERMVLNRVVSKELLSRALCSVHGSRSLRAIQFDLDDFVGSEQVEEQKRLVWWMAFALFRRATPLATLEIHAHSLFVRDIEWMEQMLAASNPMRLLFPEETDTTGPRVAHTSQVALYDPHDQDIAEWQEYWTWHSPMRLEVLGDSDNGFMPVMRPGWGKAWAREEDATIVPRTQPHELTWTAPGHLVIRAMRNETTDAVLQLIRVIGRDVKRLDIDASDCDGFPLDVFVAQVLSACPSLEELELYSMELTNFQFLQEAFQANRSPALQKLTMWKINLREKGAVDDLLLWLESPRNRMAVQLRKLSLAPEGLTSSATLDATLRMLNTNARLRDVSLRFSLAADSRIAYLPRFGPHRGSMVSEPLSPRCICAFLSVASTSKHGSGCYARHSAFHLLDFWIFRLVLDFAAAPRTRSVSFQAVPPIEAPASS